MTYGQLCRQTAAQFHDAGLEDAAFQAKQLLLSHFALSATDFILKQNENIPNSLTPFFEKAKRIQNGEPLQYLVGSWDFMGHTFQVGEGVLIPRPETEQLCELALEALKGIPNPIVLDLCAGSGCVGISIARARPDSHVILFEKSPEALVYCRRNAAANAAGNLEIQPWDIFNFYPLPDLADAIVSNPPYITTDEIPTLQKQVQYEPRMALDGGRDGLAFYRVIASQWVRHLKPGAFLAVEHGETQAEQLMSCFQSVLYDRQTWQDLSGHNRFLTGKRKIT